MTDLDNWLRGVPELKRVGEACTKKPSDIRLYVCQSVVGACMLTRQCMKKKKFPGMQLDP